MKTLATNNSNETRNAAAMVASFNPAFVDHVEMYANNTREIWEMQDNTARQLAKKMAKGLEPDREHLANSESVRRIVAAAAKIARRDEWCNPISAADLQEVRRRVAAYIIDELATWKVKNPEELKK